MNRPMLLQVNFDTTVMRGVMHLSREMIEGRIEPAAGTPPRDRAKALASAATEGSVFIAMIESMTASDPAHAAELKTLLQEAKQYNLWALSEIAKDAKAR